MNKRMHLHWVVVLLLVLGVLLPAACAPAPTAVPPTQPPAPTPTTKPAVVAPTPTTKPTVPPPTPTTKPKEPTVFRVPIASDPKSLEPSLVLELVSGWIAENLHAGLLRYDENSQLVPYLAERWEVSADGLTYTFYLRKDAKWHNGRPIVASDIKKGWERYLDPGVAAQGGADYLGSIKGAQDILDGKTKELSGVEVIDDHTFKVTTEKPDSSFLLRLGTSSTWTVPPEAVVEGKPEWKDKPVGAGPFKFVEWRRNERIVLEAFDDFFLGRPKVDRIEYYVVPDATTAVAMYEGGELEVTAVPYSELDRLQRDPKWSKELQFWTRARLIALIFNYKLVPEFGDVRVRKAIAHAINRQQLAEVVMRNSVQAAEGVVPSGILPYDPDLKGPEYDPEKARQLLAGAGYPEGKGFPRLEMSDYEDVGATEAIAAMLKANLGLDVEVNVMERGDFVNSMWARDKLMFFKKGWTADFPSAEVWLHQLLRCGVGSNFGNYCNPAYDEIVDQAMSISNPQEQVRLWRQAEKIAMEDMAVVPLVYNQYIYLVKPYVKGYRCNLSGPVWLWDVEVEK